MTCSRREAAESSLSACRVVARPRLRKYCGGGGGEGGRLYMNIGEDDPREVMARRLKVLAQAVALATASHLSTG
ncbi:hypothetical protein QJS04_geneDACA015767 [Acorus gramineus]|uniref:Uncharacterized protein n=1 Tax=Acorus gramineus TaxID=55184 RepID=A0AAV9BKP9_ACOGR|nr:hypothetical protein QJS04_geneDACA015767 [Acorus gramineus]